MKCTSKNIKRVFDLINEWHVDNFDGADFAQFDDDSDLLDVVGSVIEQVKEELGELGVYVCQNCGGGFDRDEMVFGDGEEIDVDLCKDCSI